MKINLLRQKILDLAIRGKLVPQDPNDEPASVLLERIRAEKERLIAEGKIKRPKKSKATSSESHYQQFEPPFDIPESWEWVRLGELVEFRGGYAYKSNTYVGSSNWQVVRIGNVKNDKLLLDSQPVFVPEQIGNDTIKYQIQPDDILFTMTGTKGKRDYFYSVKVPPTSTKLLLNQRVGCLRCIANVLYINYLCNVLKSTYILDTIFATETGNVSQGNIGSESTLSLYIPLPPYPEQERIVKALNELVLRLYGIDNCRGKLQETIQNAKSKILDLAMQGKLVPQDPADEPAATMLRRINPKAKIITDNQQYQQLPSKWCIAAIKDVFEINPKNKADEEIEAGFVPMASIADGFNDSFDYASRKWKEIKKGFTHFADGDIAVAKISPCLENRKSMILKNLPNGIGSGTTELLVFRSHAVYPEYGLLFFKSDSFINHCVGTFNGVVGQQRVGKNIVEDIHIPIPPLNEQKRIVKKVRDLFSLLVEIESNLLIAKS